MQNEKNEIFEDKVISISTTNQNNDDQPSCARFVDAISELSETVQILKESLEKLTIEYEAQSQTLQSQRKQAVQEKKQHRSSLLAKEEQIIELKEYYQKQIFEKERELEQQKNTSLQYLQTIQSLQKTISNFINEKNLLSKKYSDLSSQNEELHIENQYFELKINSLMKQNDYLLNVNERFKKKIATYEENNCLQKYDQFLSNAQEITFDQLKKISQDENKTLKQQENLPCFRGTKQLYTSIHDTNSFQEQCNKIPKNYFEDCKQQSKQYNKENLILECSNPNIDSGKKNIKLKRFMSNGKMQSSMSKRKNQQLNNNSSNNSINRQLFSKSGELFSKGITDTAIIKMEQNYQQRQTNQVRTPRLTHASFSIATNLSKSGRKVFENILIQDKNRQDGQNYQHPQKQFYTIKNSKPLRISSQVQYRIDPFYTEGEEKVYVDPYEAFFNLTVQSLKLNYGNLQQIIDLDLSSQWPAIKSKIPYNQWNNYLKQKLIALKNQPKLARQRWSIQRFPDFFSKTS